MVVLWSLLQSGPQTTGTRPCRGRGQLHTTSAPAHSTRRLQCTPINGSCAASGDSRRKTPMGVRAVRGLGAGTKRVCCNSAVGERVKDRDVRGSSCCDEALFGHPRPVSSLSLLLSRVAVLVQLATLCKLRQSHHCAGNARAIKPLSQIKTAVFSETEQIRDL